MTVTVDDVRAITGETSDHISDADIPDLINRAWEFFVLDLSTEVVRKLRELPTKTDYIIKDAEGMIFDTNNDGSIDYSDVTIFYYDSDNIEHEITDSFTYYAEYNRLHFSSQPTTEQMYIRYREIKTYDNDLIEQAHLWLSAYLVAGRVWGIAPRVVRVGRSGWEIRVPGEYFLNQYLQIAEGIRSGGRGVEYESRFTILDNSL